MERKEAIREWCVEKALAIEATQKMPKEVNAAGVIKTAKEIEKYITS